MGRLIRRMIQRKWDGNTQRDAICTGTTYLRNTG